MIAIAKYTILSFGVFIICVGTLMLFAPVTVRETLRKMGSTNLINYTEITLRLIPAGALIVYSDVSKYPTIVALYGWLMLVSTVVLYLVPRKVHHHAALRIANLLNPIRIQLLSPVAFLLGATILYCVF